MSDGENDGRSVQTDSNRQAALVIGVTLLASMRPTSRGCGGRKALAEGFKHWMLREGYSTKTVNDYLGAVQLYAKLAHRGELMEDHTYLAIAGIEAIYGAEALRIDERRAKTGWPEYLERNRH